GIGAEVARQLLALDWTVIGVARGAAVISSSRYRHISVDLGDTGAMRESLTRELVPAIARESWSRLGWVNNAAATGLLGVGERTDPAATLRVYAVNVVAPIWLMS